MNMDVNWQLPLLESGEQWFITEENYIKSSPTTTKLQIVDTTGAGDSWITAFITSYFSGMKIFAHLHSHKFENFSRKIDQDDYVDHLIEFSMCSGEYFFTAQLSYGRLIGIRDKI